MQPRGWKRSTNLSIREGVSSGSVSAFAVGDVAAVLSQFARDVAERQVAEAQQLRRFVTARAARGERDRAESARRAPR